MLKCSGKNKKITCLDLVLAGVLILLAAFVIYRIRVGLNYKWRWQIIPQYLIRKDPETGRLVSGLILNGFITTIKLSIWSTAAAVVIGVAMGIIRSSCSIVSKIVGWLYVQLVRNIPPIVLVFIFYFFLSSFIIEATGIDRIVYESSDTVKKIITFLFSSPGSFPVFASAVITMGVYEGAFITEIVRAGILSVEKGQWEAGRAIGMGRYSILRHIVLPQALRYILPPLAGQFISTIKDSAIVSVISVQELTFQGLELMAATYLTFEIWILITLMYFVVTFACSIVFEKIFIYTRRAQEKG